MNKEESEPDYGYFGKEGPMQRMASIYKTGSPEIFKMKKGKSKNLHENYINLDKRHKGSNTLFQAHEWGNQIG